MKSRLWYLGQIWVCGVDTIYNNLCVHIGWSREEKKREEVLSVYSLVKGCAQFLQLCLTLCDPVDCSPPGFSVHEVLQARILEWVALPFSRGSS